MADPIRLLIADDHRIVREGLKQMLAEAPDIQVCAEVSTGDAVVPEVRRCHALGPIDLVMLDIAMPGVDGLDVLQNLRSEFPDLPVLMLSMYPERHYAVRCIKLGASGYLNKSAEPDDMLGAIRKVASGERFLTASTADALARHVGGRGHGGDTESLSHREYQVFRLLTTGHSVSEIGARLSLAPNTVSNYRARNLENTTTENDVELTLYAERQGRSA